MFLNKFLLIGSGAALAGTGAGLGIYYGTQGSGQSDQPSSQPGNTDAPQAKGAPSPGPSKPA